MTHVRLSHEVLEVGDLRVELSGGGLATEEGGRGLAVRGTEVRLDEHTASSQRLQGPGTWREEGEREREREKQLWMSNCYDV